MLKISALSPKNAAESSILLFVVRNSPPRRTCSCFPYRRMHTYPTGPGFLRHDPSVKSVISFKLLAAASFLIRPRSPHVVVILRSSAASASRTLPASSGLRSFKFANLNAPFAASLITCASVRLVAPDTRLAC